MISTILRKPSGEALHHSGDVAITATGTYTETGDLNVKVEFVTSVEAAVPLVGAILNAIDKQIGRDVAEACITEWQKSKDSAG